jgi:drug/metabolite transporter (DMT)-like permease
LVKIAAFLSIYLIWGSTFLATRFAVASIPPFFVSGTRFFLAGLVLFAFAQFRTPTHLTWRNWVAATSMGALFFLICHGGLSWAARHVPSGVSALLMSSTSLWTALLELTLRSNTRPNRRMLTALFIGFIGMVMLVIRPEVLAGSTVGSLGALVVLTGAFSWALGTVLTRRMPMPKSPILASAMQMMGGGGLLLLAGVVSGQGDGFKLAQVTSASLWAMAFLTLIGSLVGFTCYVYLLSVSTPTRVATYAYVNPIVALFLGWIVGGEHPSTLSLIASGVVIAAVATVISSREKASAEPSARSIPLRSMLVADES